MMLNPTAGHAITRRNCIAVEEDNNRNVGKLANFLTMSDHAKEKARNAQKRKLLRENQIMLKKKERDNRKSSILDSLERLLNESTTILSVTENETESGTIVTHQSSCSSGSVDSTLCHATARRQIPTNSYESRQTSQKRLLGNKPLHTIQTKTDETLSEKNEDNPPRRQRHCQRRGSVTKYSLEDHPDFSHLDSGTNLIKNKNKDILCGSLPNGSGHEIRKKRSHHTGKKNIKDRTNQSNPTACHEVDFMTENVVDQKCSVNAIDKQPIPSPSIEDRPLLRHLQQKQKDLHFEQHIAPLVDSIPIPMRQGSKQRQASTPLAASKLKDNLSLANEEENNSCKVNLNKYSLQIRNRKQSTISPGMENHDHKSSTEHRYQRRGSVTKYSLDKALTSLNKTDSDNFERHQYQDDDRSAVSEQLPHRHRRFSMKNLKSQKSIFSASNSVRSTNSNEERPSLSRLLASLSSQKLISLYGNKHHAEDDQQSLASHKSEGGANFGGLTSNTTRKRYCRRGSVTKYSLDEALTILDNRQKIDTNRSPQDERSAISEGVPSTSQTSFPSRRFHRAGKNTSNAHKEVRPSNEESKGRSVVATAKQNPVPGERYQRRGGMTKYSL